MTAPADLLALAERCEREEPSFLLDSAITLAMHPEYAGEGTSTVTAKVHPYTTSIDAAVGLVPEGMAWTAGCEPDFTPFARLWEHDLVWASTPALALCAAALRARAYQT